MGLLGNIFGQKSDTNSNEKKALPWIALSTVDQLEDIANKSKAKTQVIFKHSTTCGISRMVMNMFTSSYNFSESQIDLYYLDLLSFRSVSDEVGYKFQVVHQSPQLLVIRNETTVAHASHGAIAEVDLNSFV